MEVISRCSCSQEVAHVWSSLIDIGSRAAFHVSMFDISIQSVSDSDTVLLWPVMLTIFRYVSPCYNILCSFIIRLCS